MTAFQQGLDYAVNAAKEDEKKYKTLNFLTGSPAFHYIDVEITGEKQYREAMKRFEDVEQFKGKIFYSGSPTSFPAKIRMLMLFEPVTLIGPTVTKEFHTTTKKRKSSK